MKIFGNINSFLEGNNIEIKQTTDANERDEAWLYFTVRDIECDVYYHGGKYSIQCEYGRDAPWWGEFLPWSKNFDTQEKVVEYLVALFSRREN